MNRKKTLYSFMIATWSIAWYVTLEKCQKSSMQSAKALITVLNNDKSEDADVKITDMQKISDSLDKVIRDLRLQTWQPKSTSYSYNEKIENDSLHWKITYEHQDETTTEILNALSGFDTDILYADKINNILWRKDSVMYKTIWKMHTKYKNPKITLVDKFDKENTRADYDFSSDNIRLKKNIWENFNQSYYIESRLAELAHAYQLRRDGAKTYIEKSLKDESLIKANGGVYDDLYSIPWTMEYEAHQIIEEKLKKEFIDTYLSFSDTNNIQHLYKNLALNAWFFEWYDTQKKSLIYFKKVQDRLEKIFELNWEISDERMIKNLPWYRLCHDYENKRREKWDNKYWEMAKYCNLLRVKVDSSDASAAYYDISNLYISKWDIENAIKYYQLCSPESNKETVWEFVALNCMQLGKYEEAIKIYEDQANEYNAYAIFCLMKLYDPKCLDEYEKDFPGKSEEKKEYREKKYIETKKAAK